MGHRAVVSLRAAAHRRSAEERTLTAMLFLSSCAVLGAAAVPMTPTTPTDVLAGLGVFGLAVTALVWTVRWRGWRHLGPLVLLGGVTTAVATASTDVGAASSGVGFVWVALHAALFLPRWTARAYVVAVAVALAGALWLNPYQGARHTWFFTLVTTAAAVEALASTVGRLQRLAVTDPLTGLLNRQGLASAATRVLQDTSRSDGDCTVVVIDLDGFKAVNDQHGHAAGDQLLVTLADAWRGELRPLDLLARHGGDEFVLVLPQTDRARAGEVVRRLAACSPSAWSYGLAEHRAGLHLADLLRAADLDLYRAKAGRGTALAGDGRQVVAVPSGA